MKIEQASAVEIDCRSNGDVLFGYSDERLDYVERIEFEPYSKQLHAVLKDGLLSMKRIPLGKVSDKVALVLRGRQDVLLARTGDDGEVIGGIIVLRHI